MAGRQKSAGTDVALLYAPTDDGKGARVLRARDGAFEAGEVRPVVDGQPTSRVIRWPFRASVQQERTPGSPSTVTRQLGQSPVRK